MVYNAGFITWTLWSSPPFEAKTNLKRSLRVKKEPRKGWYHFTPFFCQNQKGFQMYIILGFYIFRSLPGGWFSWWPQALWTVYMAEQQLLRFSECLLCVRHCACIFWAKPHNTEEVLLHRWGCGSLQWLIKALQLAAELGKNYGFHKSTSVGCQL